MRRLLPVVLAACALLAPASALASPTPSPRIVGGHAAPAGSWPSLVAIDDTTLAGGANPDALQQICGGTLVTAQWVLTAQHCTYNSNGSARPLSSFAVIYGSQRLDGSGTRVGVTQIARAAGYSSSTLANDIALLKLASPVPNASTLPVTVPALSALWAPGTLASVAGWGSLSEGGSYPTQLQELTGLPIVSDTDCQAAYGPFPAAVEVCAGDLARGGIDTCQGDSGGPLVVADAAGHPVLIGDTSYGSGCAEPGLPGVYGEVAGMRATIDSALGWSTAATVDAGDGVVGSGQTKTVALTSTGSAPLSVSGVALSGSGAGAFAVTRDGCTNVVLANGQACSVDVQQTAANAGQVATLALTGDGAAATKSAQLSAPAAPSGGGGGTDTTPTTTTTGATPTTTTTTTTTTATTTTPVVAPETPAQQPAPKTPVVRLPRVALTALSGHRVKVTATGAGTVMLTFTREVRKGRRTVRQTLATATVKFTNKGSKTITLKLTAAGRAALAHGRHVKAATVAEVRGTGAGGAGTGSLTLR